MGEASKRAAWGGYSQGETTSDRIHRLLGDPIGVRKNAQTTIIGWFCCYTHLEMILAAGLNSFRVTSKPTLEVADSFFHSCFRPSISGSRGKSLKESVDFLDGFVGVNSDDGLWRFYDAGRFTHRRSVSTLLICRAYRPRAPSGVSGKSWFGLRPMWSNEVAGTLQIKRPIVMTGGVAGNRGDYKGLEEGIEGRNPISRGTPNRWKNGNSALHLEVAIRTRSQSQRERWMNISELLRRTPHWI